MHQGVDPGEPREEVAVVLETRDVDGFKHADLAPAAHHVSGRLRDRRPVARTYFLDRLVIVGVEQEVRRIAETAIEAGAKPRIVVARPGEDLYRVGGQHRPGHGQNDRNDADRGQHPLERAARDRTSGQATLELVRRHQGHRGISSLRASSVLMMPLRRWLRKVEWPRPRLRDSCSTCLCALRLAR